jgi:hypothetical protein
MLSDQEWGPYFDTFKHSIFRLETHPVYTMPQEAALFARFQRGEPCPPLDGEEWPSDLRRWRSEGKSMRRVHVVRSPLSEYLRFEISWYYPANVRAGEDIRILDLAEVGDPGLPNEDFWLFDEARVVRMLYRDDGTQIGRFPVENPELDKWLMWRDLAWSHSIPLADYSIRTRLDA